MTTFMSSPQTHTPTNPALSSPLSPKRSLSVTPRRVDLELARLKQLGKVTKKYEEGDGQQYQEFANTDTTTTSPRQSVKSPDSSMTLIDDGLDTSDTGTEEDEGEENIHPQQQDLLKQLQRQLEEKQQQFDDQQKQINEYGVQLQELNKQHEHKIQQLKCEHQQQIADYQSQLLKQEKLAHETMARYMGQYESSQLKVSELARLVEKQDELIQLYMDRQQGEQHQSSDNQIITIMEADWHSLQAEKEQLEAGIVALKANMETNQAHMQMMMMVSTEIQNDFEQQKVNVEKRLVVMAEELAAKDALLLHYQELEQQQQQQNSMTHTPLERTMDLPQASLLTKSTPRSPSPTKLLHHALAMNNTQLPTPDISRYPSFVSSSSASSSIESTPLYLSARTSVPPSSPPPVTPLPPIPSPQHPSSPTASTSTSSTSSTSSLKQQQHRYQQYQQQQQSRYFYQQQQKRQPTLVENLPSNNSSSGISLRHDAPIMDPLISPTLRASSLDELQHNGKPFWKNMKNKWRTS